MSAVDATLDLSQGARDLLGTVFGLEADELQEFLTLTSELLKQGVVGREELEVNGERRTTFVASRMADPELRGARPYRNRTSPGGLLDLEA